MPISRLEYKPKALYKNGHWNTIGSHIARRHFKASYQRETIDTEDGDFLHIDISSVDSKEAVILCHGLEGGSDSTYIQEFSLAFNALQYDTIALNYRGCNGPMNSTLRLYHSGATDDIYQCIKVMSARYDKIYLIGFSLGGNLVLKYLGEQRYPIPNNIIKAIAISVPVDLEASCLWLQRKQNYIYEKRFIKSLTTKIKFKAQQFPGAIDLSRLHSIKTLYDFDDVFTGPIHGFGNAKNYYAQCSSRQFIHQIKIPTTILIANDDPFLDPSTIPNKECDHNPLVNLIVTKHGGHVGFGKFRNEENYMLYISKWFINLGSSTQV